MSQTLLWNGKLLAIGSDMKPQVGVSPELQSSIRASMEKHEGNVAAVTKELKIPAEMVELLMREDDS